MLLKACLCEFLSFRRIITDYRFATDISMYRFENDHSFNIRSELFSACRSDFTRIRLLSQSSVVISSKWLVWFWLCLLAIQNAAFWINITFAILNLTLNWEFCLFYYYFAMHAFSKNDANSPAWFRQESKAMNLKYVCGYKIWKSDYL